MPIVAADIVFKGSSPGAAAGNATANGGAGTNRGNFASSGTLTDASLNNVFGDVTGDENAANAVVDYQCIFVHNNHGSLALQSAVVYMTETAAQGVDVAIGVDTTAASAVNSGSAQALTIANRTTAPAGVAFSSPSTKGTGLALGTLNAGQVKAIWIRRTSANRAAVNADAAVLTVAGDTAA